MSGIRENRIGNPARHGRSEDIGAYSGSPRLAYSVSEAAEAIGLGRTTLYTLIGSGELASCRIGGRRLIRRVDLEGLLDGNRIAA